ncbi:MAG: hypothetical protein EA409_02660 [Saprospirales bacterium]|nr:MAG: hypothetical protein EA409_02660 [Saprospirales bacterium]
MGRPQLFFFFLTLIALTILFSSCGEEVKFSNKITFDGAEWTYENPFVNRFEVTDTSHRYHLVLDIEHERDYAFQNIYMKIHTRFPNDTLVTDMLSVDMADRAGQWHGNCRGEICYLRVFLQQNISFRDPGEHLIEFEQFTRREHLPGIHSLEFKILPR